MLSKEREKELLQKYHQDKKEREAVNAECAAALQNFKAIMARNSSRIVTTQKNKIHHCHQCNAVILGGSQAWYTPSRIAAKSSRCTDAAYTGARYTCGKCQPIEEKQP